jgi:cytidylate kinase
MNVVTVSRELGSGGRVIAAEVARVLDFRLIDKEMLHRAAEETHLSETRIEDLDERWPGVLEKVRWLPEGRRYRQILERVLGEYADEGGSVIVGRGGVAILGSRPDVLHVRIVAPRDARVSRLVERDAVSRESAERRIRESDENRAAFHRHFFHQDWDDPLLYDVVVNTGLQTVEDAVRLIVAAARGVGAAGPGLNAK